MLALVLKDKGDEHMEDESIYSKESRENMVEEDELTPEEAAFMQGYEEAG